MPQSDRSTQGPSPEPDSNNSDHTSGGLDIRAHWRDGLRASIGRAWVDRHGREVLILIGFVVSVISVSFVVVRIWGK